jgi:hypothetical protein
MASSAQGASSVHRKDRQEVETAHHEVDPEQKPAHAAETQIQFDIAPQRREGNERQQGTDDSEIHGRPGLPAEASAEVGGSSLPALPRQKSKQQRTFV